MCVSYSCESNQMYALNAFNLGLVCLSGIPLLLPLERVLMYTHVGVSK